MENIVEKWRREDGTLSIPVPQCDLRINVVDRYRHLGTIVMANGNDVPNARLRAKSAAPLKLSLYMCFVVSRNSFSIQRPSDCCLCVQPRSGTPRFERDEHALSDLDVRRTLKVPFVRLYLDAMYAEVRGTHCSDETDNFGGHAVRSDWGAACPSQWLVRVQVDLHFVWKTVAVLASAPPPDLEAPFWVGVMRVQGTMGSDSEICAFLRVGTGQQSCNEEDGCSNVGEGLRVQGLQQEVRF